MGLLGKVLAVPVVSQVSSYRVLWVEGANLTISKDKDNKLLSSTHLAVLVVCLEASLVEDPMLPRKTTTTDTPPPGRVEHTAVPHHLQAIRRLDSINRLHNTSLRRNTRVDLEGMGVNHIRARTVLSHHKGNMARRHSSIALRNMAQPQLREDMDTTLLHMTNTASMGLSQGRTIHLRPHRNMASISKDTNQALRAVTVNRLLGSIPQCQVRVSTDNLHLVASTDSHSMAKVSMVNRLREVNTVGSMAGNSTSSHTVVDTRANRRVTSITKARDLLHLDGRSVHKIDYGRLGGKCVCMAGELT